MTAKSCMHLIIGLRLSKSVLLKRKKIINGIMTNLRQLMPNPQLVIQAVPLTQNVVGSVSLCVFKDLYAVAQVVERWTPARSKPS